MTTTLLRQTRDDVLRNIDLTALLNESNPDAQSTNAWPCPHNHSTPSVSVFGDQRHTQRWHCSICGTGGTAIDFVMCTDDLGIGDALQLLQRLTESTTPMNLSLPDSAVEYLDTCRGLLWSNTGVNARAWLHTRAVLHEPTLRINEIGFDPGTGELERPKGIPANGPAITFPIRHPHHNGPVSMQSLPLYASRENDEWISPSHNLGGPPRTAWLTTHQPTAKAVILTDNLIDALSAATLGHQAIAALATTITSQHSIEQLVELCHSVAIDNALICFRNDASTEIVAAVLDHIDLAKLQLPENINSLNQLLQQRQPT